MRTGNRFEQARGPLNSEFLACAEFDLSSLEAGIGVVIDDIPDIGHEGSDRFVGANLGDAILRIFTDMFVAFFDQLVSRGFSGARGPAEAERSDRSSEYPQHPSDIHFHRSSIGEGGGFDNLI